MFRKSGKKVDWLADVSFFEGFSPEQLQRVENLGDEVDVDAGAVLVDQGVAALDCYVVVEGSASVFVAGEHIASVDEGSMIGERALVDHRPRNARVDR